jgi:hypothetical protein
MIVPFLILLQAATPAPTVTHRFLDGSGSTTISVELDDSKPYLPVRVNGKGPYFFLLDTGSVANVVDMEVAKALGISLTNPWQASGAGEGTLESAVGTHVTLGVGASSSPRARSTSSP